MTKRIDGRKRSSKREERGKGRGRGRGGEKREVCGRGHTEKVMIFQISLVQVLLNLYSTGIFHPANSIELVTPIDSLGRGRDGRKRVRNGGERQEGAERQGKEGE